MKIKVCGMKYEENIVQVAALQPDYLGFIFWESSSRSFFGKIPSLPKNVKKVGVFVDSPISVVLENVEAYNLDLVQLHGGEDAAYCASLQEELKKRDNPEKGPESKVEIAKAMAVDNDFAFDNLRSYKDVVDYFLFDSKGPLPGGNGFGFNWELLKEYDLDTPYFLSGGIGLHEVENLRKFLKTPMAEKCHAIDVNSAFEQKPGLKDTQLVQAFIEKIKL